MTDECAFCPNPADSREHLWGEWIGDLWGPRTYEITRHDRHGKVKTFRQNTLNIRSWEVCSGCNNGWMSDFENETKYIAQDLILHGTRRTFGVRDIQIVASLVLIKAIVADRLTAERPPILSAGERRTFARTLTIPTGVQMWLASLPDTRRGIFKNIQIETAGSTARDFHAQIFTFGAGHFVAQCVAARWRKRTANRTRNEILLTQNPVWDEVSVPFWPFRDAVDWPPRHNLTNILIDEFTNRWTRLVVSDSSSPLRRY